jgi:hypothetical protein
MGMARRRSAVAAPLAALRSLTLEATGQLTSLEGIQTCIRLENLEILDARATSLAPLRQLTRLRTLHLIGSHRIDQDAVLDLSDIARLDQLEAVTITHAGTVTSLKPLLQLPRLRELRLGDTFALDHDLTPLDHMPQGAMVVGPDG